MLQNLQDLWAHSYLQILAGQLKLLCRPEKHAPKSPMGHVLVMPFPIPPPYALSTYNRRVNLDAKTLEYPICMRHAATILCTSLVTWQSERRSYCRVADLQAPRLPPVACRCCCHGGLKKLLQAAGDLDPQLRTAMTIV